MWHLWRKWRKGEVCTRYWWGNFRERDRWGDQGVGGRKEHRLRVFENRVLRIFGSKRSGVTRDWRDMKIV
jgi:hypothetical protein